MKHTNLCKRAVQKPLSLLDASGCLCAAGDCEGCNALADAFKAMREALGYLETGTRRYVEGKDASSSYLLKECGKARAALALADKVMTRGR